MVYSNAFDVKDFKFIHWEGDANNCYDEGMTDDLSPFPK